MLKLRPYKPCDAETIVSWCKDEESFRRWTSDRYDSFPITALQSGGIQGNRRELQYSAVWRNMDCD